MPLFNLPPDSWATTKDEDGRNHRILKKEALDSFSLEILGLGNIATKPHPVESFTAVFDLGGFTNFCKQIEPHLSISKYLNGFLTWLLQQIKNETINKSFPEGSKLWHPLPFYAKFMGDGLLLLWKSDEMSTIQSRNLVVSLSEICYRYKTEFLPTLSSVITDPPATLRCGIALGRVFSVGEDADYIGSSINMASRIQKLPGVTFAFNRRGFDLEEKSVASFFKESILIKKVLIRGIGDNELIGVLKSDFNKMSKEDAAIFRNP